MDGTLHYIHSTTSTQDVARRLLDNGKAKPGDAIVADEQTAGRGRFGRLWASPHGGLYATIIMRSEPLLSLKAGLAIVNVLRRAGVSAGLKWPNDVLIGERKLAGVLVEESQGVSLVGIGVNLTSSPVETATHLFKDAPASNRDTWAREIMEELIGISEHEFDWAAYKAVCRTLGLLVRVQGVNGNVLVEGIATDVDPSGRLIVTTAHDVKVISSGECLHVKAKPSAIDLCANKD